MDLNQCTFTGRLGRDPELKYTHGGTAVASISIAVGGRKKDGEQWIDTTEWVPVTLFGRLAEIVGEYTKKGSRVLISGRFTTRTWDQDGQKRYKSEIVAESMILLDAKQDGSHGNGESRHGSPASQPRNTSMNSQQPARDDAWLDDDIPF